MKRREVLIGLVGAAAVWSIPPALLARTDKVVIE
jgi:hypothetical protein